MPNLLALNNLQLIAHVRANVKATATEVHLAERLDEARHEIDEIIKNFADFIIVQKGPEGAIAHVLAAQKAGSLATASG